MKQYLDACKYILDHGTMKDGRNGRYVGTQGMMMKFDLADGFPLVTTKSVNFGSIVAELFAFIQGAQNAKTFRNYGTRIWDMNANGNHAWLVNKHRNGNDDLGRIYGAQWRGWRRYSPILSARNPKLDRYQMGEIDQLKNVIETLKQHRDTRREIVLAWNPGELDQMALPPCPALFQFGIGAREDRLRASAHNYNDKQVLNMCMYQRSCDFPLGVPFDVASYSLLLLIVAKIIGLPPGTFTNFLWDCHIYENQLELMKGQVQREPRQLPYVKLPDRIDDIDDVGTLIMPKDIKLINYDPYPTIKYPFSV